MGKGLRVTFAVLLAVPVAIGAPLGDEGLRNPGTAPVSLYLHLGNDGLLAVNAEAPTRDWTAPANCTQPLAVHVSWMATLVGTPFRDLQDELPVGGLFADIALHSATARVAFVLPAASLPMPEAHLSVELVSGHPMDESTNLEDHPVIAHGRSDAKAIPPAAAATTHDFIVPLELDTGEIGRLDGATLRLAFQTGVPCNATPGIALVNDEAHRPRLEVAASPSVDLAWVEPEPVAGIVLIHVAAASPWGRYDLDIANATIAIAGPSTPRDLSLIIASPHSFGYPERRWAEFTWLWRFRADNATVEGGPARDGDYRIEVTLQNMQHTATAIGVASFNVEADHAFGVDDDGRTVQPSIREEQVPALPPGVTLLLLCAAVIVRTRRSVP